MKAVFKLLQGYKDQPPVAIVFCGNFCSRPRQTDTIDLLDRGFRWLANQLTPLRKDYEKTQFIFVPGPDDPFVDTVKYIQKCSFPKISKKKTQFCQNRKFRRLFVVTAAGI